jgi:hypothetical protein
MTHAELRSLILDVKFKVNALASTLPRGSAPRHILDEHRNALEDAHRTLSFRAIEDNTPAFQALTASLSAVNTELHRTINDVNKIARTLEALVQFTGVVQKILQLLPVAA